MNDSPFPFAYDSEETNAYLPFAAVDLPGDKYFIPALTQVLSPGARVLDYGCGAGHLIPTLLQLGAGEVVGTEPSAPMLEEARRNLADDERVRLDLLERLPLPYADAAFDGITARFVFHYIRDTKPVISEMARVLKPGGWLLAIFSDVHFKKGSETLENEPLPLRFRDMTTARTLAKPGVEIKENAQREGLIIERYDVLPRDATAAKIDASYEHANELVLETALLVARKI